MTSTPDGALRWMKDKDAANATGWAGYCLKAVRTAWGLPGGHYDADAWWDACPPEHRHPWTTTPPPGAPVYWRIGQHGHVAMAVGDGTIYGTDLPTYDQIGHTSINAPRDAWGATPVGWASWIQGVALPLEEDDDMPLSDSDIARIADAVWAKTFMEYTDENGNGKRDARSTGDLLAAAHSAAVTAPVRVWEKTYLEYADEDGDGREPRSMADIQMSTHAAVIK